MSITKILKKNNPPERFDSPLNVELREDAAPGLRGAAEELAHALNIPLIIARILACRGICSLDDARAFLYPSLREHLSDPFQIKNIQQAADLLLRACKEGKRVTIFSDFDVDGLTAGVQLVLFLSSLGADADVYVPSRFSEGYGLSAEAVERLARSGTELLLTVDCGITCCKELALARRLGLMTIVLDHHEPGAELPCADVVVDPAQEGCPYQEYALAAAGLAWMLLIVLRAKAPEILGEEAAGRKLQNLQPKDFLDLAAIGTICDMVPLHGMNRLIAYRGLEALQKTARPGLIALQEVSGLKGKKLTCGQIGFMLGPRINAAGRLGDANEVVELFTTSDDGKAKQLAQKINRMNEQRRSVEEEVLNCCLRKIAQDPQLLAQPALFLYGKDYHLGVIGIVAQRLVERFNRPAAVAAPGETVIEGEVRQVVKGSVRSVKGFHVAEVLDTLDSLLIGHGGHAAAGGFSVAFDQLERFGAAFVEAAARVLGPEHLLRRVTADLKISLNDVDFALAAAIAGLAPFGVGNPAPLFISEGVRVESAALVAEKHLRLRLSDGACFRTAVAWGMSGHPLLRKGEQVNVAYHVELNTYKGVSSVQLNVKEVWR